MSVGMMVASYNSTT